MSLFENAPEPLRDLSLMFGGGAQMKETSAHAPEYLAFGTVVRAAPIEEGGELVLMDWSEKNVLAKIPMRPRNPTIGEDPDPRGNARGCRGLRWHDGQIIAATYHSLELYDESLERVGDVSGGLMAGLHEIGLTDRGTVWVSSTAIDAAVEYDLKTGEQIRAFWPREMATFQSGLGLEPLSIDKSADNRLEFLRSNATQTSSHLHLNAVEEYEGRVYALCNSHATVLDLTRERVALRHEDLQGAHNLRITDQGAAIINDTFGRAVQIFDLETGRRTRLIDLTQYQWIRSLIRWQIPSYWGRELATRTGLMEDVVARPLFVRGLARHGGFLFVGVSPAAILQIDVSTGTLVDAYQYSADVHVCVHGLDVRGGASSLI